MMSRAFGGPRGNVNPQFSAGQPCGNGMVARSPLISTIHPKFVFKKRKGTMVCGVNNKLHPGCTRFSSASSHLHSLECAARNLTQS